MSEAEHPNRVQPHREVTLEDLRTLMGASTPHFALQIRTRIANLVDGLEPEHEVRLAGEREMERLRLLGLHGETRGSHTEEALPPLPSLRAIVA